MKTHTGNGHAKREHITIHPSRCRINMLHGDNFKAAFLAEFGFTQKAIGLELGLSIGQVHYRLKRAGVKTRDYRQGKGVIARMIINGVRRAGVPQLREFTEDHLRRQLRQIGWKEGATRPEF